jgi:hypothetical protein
MMSSMAVVEAYSRLKSLRQNVPSPYVDTRFVAEFHSVLGLLEEGSRVDLSNFRIPSTEVRPVSTGGNYLTGETDYSTEPYGDHSYFVMKVDAVLMMFEVLLGSGGAEKPQIGFKPPTR